MTETPRADLAAAFSSGPVSRAAGLASLLPPRPPDTTPAEPAPQAPARPAAKKRAVELPSAPAASSPRNVGAYLPPDVLEELKDYQRASHATYDTILVEAFDTVSETELSEAFAPRPALEGSRMPARRVDAAGEAGIQRQFRLDDAQIAWLRQVVKRTNAPSRSALIATVLRIFFEKRSRTTGS